MPNLPNDNYDEIDDFVDVVEVDTDPLQNDAMYDQGHGMLIGNNIKLAPTFMIQLKAIVDEQINDSYEPSLSIPIFDVTTTHIADLAIAANNSRLNNIPVAIEQLPDGGVLAKVGPCDLSGVGGHHVREQIIKNVVDQALQQANMTGHSYESVNVSACVGVRGRLQMFQGAFINNREGAGNHMNAYVKTAQEKQLTHWEPREGAQSFFNDTICAMVSSVCTSLFEKGIREKSIQSSAEATEQILKSPALKEAFDHLLSVAINRITALVTSVKNFATTNMKQIKDELTTLKDDTADDMEAGATPKNY